jgi:hypothetical protein
MLRKMAGIRRRTLSARHPGRRAGRHAWDDKECMDLKTTIHDIVGRPYCHSLFYEFPGGLRFELSKEGGPLDRALTALRKAIVICEDVFRGEERMLVHLSIYASESRFRLRKALLELHVAGIFIPKARAIWLDAERQASDGHREDNHLINCAFEVPTAKLYNLLWCAMVRDSRSLRPNPHCNVYLLNPNKSIVVHPYDDRGMDVIGRRTADLTGLYERYHDLLLRYDIEAMRETFAGLTKPKNI